MRATPSLQAGVTMTATTTADPTAPTARHFTLAVLALAMGGFAIGTTEFVTMGLLPQIADGVGVSIPTGGHVISAYAVGVVVGAPVLAFFGAKWPRRGLLVALMAAYAVVQRAERPRRQLRDADGVPVPRRAAARRLLRGRLAGRRRAWPRPGARAAPSPMVMLGLSVANVVGVPAATWLGQNLGWRAAYWAVAGPRAGDRRAGRGVRARLPGQPGGHRPARAVARSPSRRSG